MVLDDVSNELHTLIFVEFMHFVLGFKVQSIKGTFAPSFDEENTLSHYRTCCLLLSNSLNRRSLAITPQSPFI